MHVIGGDHSYPALARDPCKRRKYLPLLSYPMILKLYIEVVFTENAAVFFGDGFCAVIVSRDKTGRYLTRKARRKRNKSAVIFSKKLVIHTRTRIKALGIAQRH